MADNEEDVDVNELTDVNQTEDTENVESADSDESLNSEGEDNAPAKKNKSNWKKMKQELKALKAENAALKSSTTDEDDSDDDSDSDDTDDEEDEPISTLYAPIELKVLFLENPGAKEYEKEIRANLKEYPNMKFDKAFALAKASNPVSETKRNLSFKNSSKPKDITSLSTEEALKLDDPKAYLEWARKTGNIKE